jgi:type VI secretion system protein ImpH
MTTNIPDQVLEHAQSYNFYQLVELLHQLKETDPEIIEGFELIFSANASLGFAKSDVSDLSVSETGQLSLETTFLGLHGAQSPLPGYMLEQILNEDETGVRRLFLDFFNHRLITLVHQIWRKYRYYLRFTENATDILSNQLFALVGLSEVELRKSSGVNWCKMLSYSGMLAGRARSPQMVSGIIAHCFDLPHVTIKQWVVRKVAVPDQQKFLLGKANHQLGHDALIGANVKDSMGKFAICLHQLPLETYMKFLPSGEHYSALAALVEFTLREQMAFDLELELQQTHSISLQLNAKNPSALGWSSFTGNSAANKTAIISVRH